MLKSFIYSLLMSLVVTSAYADVASLESNYVAGQADIVDKLNNDRTTLANSVNNVRGVFAGGVQSSGQIKSETIGLENIADEANPQIRTNEGASCADFIPSGLIPETSASLIGNISAGVGYPDGYRIEKTSSTARAFTPNKWTYGYLLTSGSFDYQEVNIGSAVPTAPANSAVLFRVSTDTATINSVQDLRITSCTSGPFSILSDATGEASLGDILQNGKPNTVSTDTGFVQGLWVSYDTATTFKVRSGTAYINGKYRIISNDVTVAQTADDPMNGISGIDTTPISSSTKYNVFAVADQSNVKYLSVTYSSAAAPSGVTNYRKIGEIKTDGSSNFTKTDIRTSHYIQGRERVGGWLTFDNTGTVKTYNRMNVSSISDNGTGKLGVTWDQNFASGDGAIVCGTNWRDSVGGSADECHIRSDTGASIEVVTVTTGGALVDNRDVKVIAVGDIA